MGESGPEKEASEGGLGVLLGRGGKAMGHQLQDRRPELQPSGWDGPW